MTASPVRGLHHVTAIAGDAQRNLDFYTQALGQRLVKRTVNFDAPGVYHFYFADGLGTPGTVMTFFPFPNARPGRVGAGQVTRTHYAVPPGALPFWRDRLPARGATLVTEAETRFGEPRAVFADPDGLLLTLVEREDPRAPWTAPDVPREAALRGFQGVTLGLHDGSAALRALTEVFGYDRVAEEPAPSGRLVRLEAPGAEADVIELHLDPDMPAGREGAGTVHHVAFRVPDRAAQLEVRRAMTDLGLQVTEPIDRQYFHAIYSRIPGGVLFEVATDEPGFLVDEPQETLGEALRLPPQYEPRRAEIEAALPPISA